MNFSTYMYSTVGWIKVGACTWLAGGGRAIKKCRWSQEYPCKQAWMWRTGMHSGIHFSPPTFNGLNDIHSLCAAQIWSIWTYTESRWRALITKHILYKWAHTGSTFVYMYREIRPYTCMYIYYFCNTTNLWKDTLIYTASSPGNIENLREPGDETTPFIQSSQEDETTKKIMTFQLESVTGCKLIEYISTYVQMYTAKLFNTCTNWMVV